jgi:hypothetical protein
MSKLRIVAAVVDVRQLKMYQDNGQTIEIPQGDPRVAELLAQITPVIRAGGVAEIELEIAGKDATFAAFEETSRQNGGLVKLFRMAKKKVAEFFANRVPDQQVGAIPKSQEERSDVFATPTPAVPDAAAAAKDNMDRALEDIMEHAVPASSSRFHDAQVGDDADDTVVAVIEKQDGSKTIVPHIERITGQLERATKLGTTAAVEAFMSRIGEVMDRRSHSVDDLLKFMKRGDLPIAEDGSIIIYKVLRRHPDKEGYYVDCHTRKVTQRIGSFVHMDESLVDRNRNNECSNGLHVARRGYLGGFSGDVCVLGKVRPEDVIAVPTYDANKMRVCGYHILFELDGTDYSKLKSNQAITDTERGQQLLARAINGDHIGIIEDVKIGGQLGTNVQITPRLITSIMSNSTKKTEVTDTSTPKLAEAIDIEEKPAPKLDAPIVDPKSVADAAAKPLGQTAKAAQLHLALLQARDGDSQKARAKELFEFKRGARKSWTALGLTDADGEAVSKLLGKLSPKHSVSSPTQPEKVRPVKPSLPVAPKDEALEKAQKKALNLLKDGLSNAEVAQKTGLSKDQVYRLKKKLQS